MLHAAARSVMVRVSRPSGRWRRAPSPGTGSGGFGWLAKQWAQANPRADAEFAVHPAQMYLDGLDRHEQVLCDFLVAQPVGCHLRDPPLACGQRVETAEKDSSAVRAGGGKLVVRPRDECARAAALREIDPVAQQRPGFA